MMEIHVKNLILNLLKEKRTDLSETERFLKNANELTDETKKKIDKELDELKSAEIELMLHH